MCKLLGINNLKKVKLTTQLLKEMAGIMAVGNSDGIGLVIDRKDTPIFHKGFTSKQSINAIGLNSGKMKIKTAKKIESNSKDLNPSNNRMLLMHSRTSTNNESLNHCHPFNLRDGFYFAHNGIVTPEKNNYPLLTDNDSEYLAHEFMNKGLKALENFSGYAATIAIDNRKMKIFRDNKAELFISHSEKLDTFLITTKYHDALLLIELLSDDFTIPELIQSNYYFELSTKAMTVSHDIERVETSNNIDQDLLDKSMGFTGLDDPYSFDNENTLTDYTDDLLDYQIIELAELNTEELFFYENQIPGYRKMDDDEKLKYINMIIEEEFYNETYKVV